MVLANVAIEAIRKPRRFGAGYGVASDGLLGLASDRMIETVAVARSPFQKWVFCRFAGQNEADEYAIL